MGVEHCLLHEGKQHQYCPVIILTTHKTHTHKNVFTLDNAFPHAGLYVLYNWFPPPNE